MPDEPNLQPDPVQPAPQPASQPEPAPEPAPSVLRSVYEKRYGTTEDLSRFESDEQIAEALFSMADQYAQSEPLIKVGQQVAPHYDQWEAFQKWQAEQQQAKEAPAEPEEPQFEWQTKDYDPAWESVDPATDPMGYAQAQAKLKEYKRWEQDTQRRLLREYPDLTKKAVEPLVKQMRAEMEERIAKIEGTIQERDQQTAQQAAEAEQNEWIREHAKEFYQHDAEGKPVVQNGQAVPTDYFKQVWQQLEWARGLKDSAGNPVPFSRAAQIAVAQVPKPQAEEPKKSAEPPPRFIDTVSEAEMRPPERNPGGDTSAPASMYQNTDAVVDAAIRQAAKQHNHNMNE